MNKSAMKAQEVFREKFSGEPALYFSPGRINLIGEHIDYNDGYVLPAAINKGIYFAMAPNDSDRINFFSLDFEESFSVKLSEIKKSSGWKNYVLSVVNEFLLAGKEIKGFDCVTSGDIPQGSGMSSSAAIEGGLAFALNDLFDCGFDKVALALLCQSAEHNFPAVNCGIMDQFANMMGKKDHVILLDCKNITHRYFPLLLQDHAIILVNSKVHHSLAASAYNERRRQCEEGLKIIREEKGIGSFRDINPELLLSFKSRMSMEVFNRCKYVVEETARTIRAAQLLEENNLYEFGQLMFKTHEGLSKLYAVSCNELDFLTDYAAGYPGVIGARLMGGGFGGCTINIINKGKVNDFAAAVKTAYSRQFGIEAEIYSVATGDGTKKLL